MRRSEIRSPFAMLPTRLPGVQFTEHLPLQASIADKLTIIRSVDCSASNHTPITMQAGNPLARRTDDGRDGAGYPSMGSITARFRGPNDPDLPAFVGLAPSWAADVYGAGHLGSRFEPVKGLELSGKFALPSGVVSDRLADRNHLRRQFDRLRQELDRARRWSSSTAIRSKRLKWCSPGKCRRRSISMLSEMPRVTNTVAPASEKRPCSPGDWSRPGLLSSWSAANGATSTITATTSSGAES